MSEPVNIFQPTRRLVKTGHFMFLSKQVVAWQQLTKKIQPLLPQPEQWQIACYQNGILTLTGLNQAMVSQLSYLQSQYVAQLSQLPELKQLTKIQVLIRTAPQVQPEANPNPSRQLSQDTKEMLRNAALFVNDPKLSQALLRFARDEK